MDDHHHYHLAHGTRPRMEFPSRMPLPPPGHSPRQGHIPCSSSQFRAPPPPAHAAFQSHRSTEAAYNQSSVAFHSHSYPPPTDFSCPPPSFHQNYGNDPSGSVGVVQHQGEGVPPYQDYGMPPCQNYGFSATVSTSLDIRSQPALEAPENFGGGSHVNLDSCHMRSTSGAFSVSEDACKSKEEDDQTWLNNFEQRILERRGPQNESITAKKKPLKLIEVQQMVRQSRILTDKLFQLKEKMSLLSNDDQDQVWWELLNQAEKIKIELNGITQKFQDEVFMEDVHKLIHQRKNKRERKKRQHKLKVKQKEKLKELWKKEEEKIDAWREKLRLKEEEKRRETAIKTEADSILGEVRQKQIDGVKMQQLLESLVSLRVVRLNKGAAHGFISTPQQDHLFTTTLKNITEVVNTQMDEYKLEEQTLRVMMEETTSYQRSNAGKEPRDLINKLETSMKKVLFGATTPIDQEIHDDFTAADRCLHSLIQRRIEWDQFICHNLPLASSVPVSWVIPPSQPSAPWDQFLV